MSDSERPDLAAFEELQHFIRMLGDEMAAWRRRAHEAEARLKELDAALAQAATPANDPTTERTAGAGNGTVEALERENQELRQRLEGARARTKQLLDRLRFLRQQHEMGAER
ncbi:MAG: hypothetical protein IRY91_06320 [Gemmatimonadaceae bacterium]|nr:hypothetical protein [Gemmatimonadaceae bacterium]